LSGSADGWLVDPIIRTRPQGFRSAGLVIGEAMHPYQASWFGSAGQMFGGGLGLAERMVSKT